MNNADAFGRMFFSRFGVEATADFDGENRLVFIVDTAAFEARRERIDPWFSIVSQDEQTTVLRERLRGTGQTVS